MNEIARTDSGHFLGVVTPQTQKAYAECVLYFDERDNCPHLSWWATLKQAQDAAEKRYVKRLRDRAYTGVFAPAFEWRHVEELRRWELFRYHGSARKGKLEQTQAYVDEIEIQGATVAPLDLDSTVSRIAIAVGLDADAEGRVRKILGAL